MKTTTTTKTRFLIGQNGTKCANFRGNPLFQSNIQHKNKQFAYLLPAGFLSTISFRSITEWIGVHVFPAVWPVHRLDVSTLEVPGSILAPARLPAVLSVQTAWEPWFSQIQRQMRVSQDDFLILNQARSDLVSWVFLAMSSTKRIISRLKTNFSPYLGHFSYMSLSHIFFYYRNSVKTFDTINTMHIF